MKVWVAQRGLYSSMYVAGVYASAELAMAEFPGKWKFRPDENEWSNDLDWEDAVYIVLMNVIGSEDAIAKVGGQG